LNELMVQQEGGGDGYQGHDLAFDDQPAVLVFEDVGVEFFEQMGPAGRFGMPGSEAFVAVDLNQVSVLDRNFPGN
jgi:hypothetical protein